jgi:hypothetical protein
MHCLDVASTFKINGSKSYVDNIKSENLHKICGGEFSFGLEKLNARLRSHEFKYACIGFCEQILRKSPFVIVLSFILIPEQSL